MPADITADVMHLPLKDSIADTVIFDPPFGRKFKKQYGAYYSDRRKAFKEVLRILKPGGLLIFSHYFIPCYKILLLEDVYMIHNQPWEHVRALSFSRRQKDLLEILPIVDKKNALDIRRNGDKYRSPGKIEADPKIHRGSRKIVRLPRNPNTVPGKNICSTPLTKIVHPAGGTL